MKIETNRLLLRPFNEQDVAAFAQICADPDVMRYIGGGTHSYKETEKKVAKFIDHFCQKGYSLFAMIYKENNEFIGFCGLIDQVVNDQPYVELGYRINKNYWNQAIATEAATAVKQFAFETLKLPKLISIIQPANIASRRIAEKMGMSIDQETDFNGIPVVIYAMCNPAAGG